MNTIRVVAVCTLATLFLRPTLSLAQDRGTDQAPPTTTPIPAGSDSLRHLVENFLADPIHYARAYSAIIDSAEASPYVHIILSASVMPWACGDTVASSPRRAFYAVLLGAFVAGDMRAQLASGRKGDQPLAGIVAVIGVYEKLRERVLNFRVPAIDHWMALQARGELEAYAADIAAHPARDCPASG